MNNFQKSELKDEKCPKCKSYVIHVYGLGWDNDRKWCSNINCDYEKEYITTTYIKDKR